MGEIHEPGIIQVAVMQLKLRAIRHSFILIK